MTLNDRERRDAGKRLAALVLAHIPDPDTVARGETKRVVLGESERAQLRDRLRWLDERHEARELARSLLDGLT